VGEARGGITDKSEQRWLRVVLELAHDRRP
jgi:hypothetical protein